MNREFHYSNTCYLNNRIFEEFVNYTNLSLNISSSKFLICAFLMNIQYYTIHFSTNLCNTKSILSNQIQGI